LDDANLDVLLTSKADRFDGLDAYSDFVDVEPRSQDRPFLYIDT